MHTNQINSNYFHIVINLGYNTYTFGTNMQSKAQCRGNNANVQSSAFPIGFLIEILQKFLKNS